MWVSHACAALCLRLVLEFATQLVSTGVWTAAGMASLVRNSPMPRFLMGAALLRSALGIAEPTYGPRCGVPKIATSARQIVVGITYQIFGD